MLSGVVWLTFGTYLVLVYRQNVSSRTSSWVARRRLRARRDPRDRRAHGAGRLPRLRPLGAELPLGDAETPGMPVLLALSRTARGRGRRRTTRRPLPLSACSRTARPSPSSRALRRCGCTRLPHPGSIGLLSRDYVRGDLAGAFVAACFDSGEIAAAVSAEANAERCLAYVAGRADLSTVQLLQ